MTKAKSIQLSAGDAEPASATSEQALCPNALLKTAVMISQSYPITDQTYFTLEDIDCDNRV